MAPSKTFRRSTTDRKIAGVCAGLADHMGVDVGMVRIAAVFLLVVASTPVLFGYVVAAVVVPQGETHPPALDITWGANSLRVSWRGSIAPYSLSWPRWLGIVLAGVALVSQLGVMAIVALTLMDVPGLADLVGTLLFGIMTMTWPVLILAIVAPMVPRPYTVTLTDDALWLERPLRTTRRLSLQEVEEITDSDAGAAIHLTTGELIRLPPAPTDEAWATLVKEVGNAKRRTLQHAEDLGALASTREQVEDLLSRE